MATPCVRGRWLFVIQPFARHTWPVLVLLSLWLYRPKRLAAWNPSLTWLSTPIILSLTAYTEFVMVGVAQLVRAPGCGPGGRGFETPRPPQYLSQLADKPRGFVGYLSIHSSSRASGTWIWSDINFAASSAFPERTASTTRECSSSDDLMSPLSCRVQR